MVRGLELWAADRIPYMDKNRMTRSKCPNCGVLLDAYDLIGCPKCHVVFGEYDRSQFDLLKQQKEALATEIVTHIWRRLVGRLLAIFLAVLTLAGIGLWQLYKAVTADLPGLVSSDINQRFAQPNITKLMEEAAKERSGALMENIINPELSKFQNQLNEKVTSFQEFLEQSKGELQRQIEALNPYRQPLVTGHATVQITVKSDEEVRTRVFSRGAFLEFIKEETRLLLGGSRYYDKIQSGEGFIYYTADLMIRVDNAGRGLPVFSLQDINSIKLVFHGIPDNSEILGGGLWCTINNSIPLAFRIPAQIAQGKEIIIPDIHKPLQALKP